MHRRLLALPALFLATPALAHAADSDAQSGADWAGPLIALGALLYAAGLLHMVRSGKPGLWRPLPPWRIAAFGGGIVVLIIALLSPLDELADSSFAAHMLQHLLLMTVAAPLFAVSNGQLVLLQAFPLGGRRGIGRTVAAIPGVRQGGHSRAAPWIACAAFSAAMLLWHIPGAYDLALHDETIHTLEHISFLATSTAFWRIVSTAGDRRLGLGMSVLMVSLVGLEGALLAALLTFASHPLYAAYADAPHALSDQVLAGVLMWVPASLAYVGTTVLALGRLVRATGSPSRLTRS